MIPLSERQKTVYAWNRTTTLIGEAALLVTLLKESSLEVRKIGEKYESYKQ